MSPTGTESVVPWYRPSGRYRDVVVTLTVELDDHVAARLQRRAQRLGLDVTILAGRIVAEAVAEPDPFDFVGSFASDVVSGRHADLYLISERFGHSRP